MSLRYEARPLEYLTAQGTRAETVLPLTWGMMAISVIVVLIISGLVVAGIARHRAPAGLKTPVARSGDGMRWLTWGVGISTVVLFATVIWTMTTLAATVREPEEPSFTVTVSARQWWWRLDYRIGDDAETMFTTANELRIPVGETVALELTSPDVIHSFWVPALSGKTDLIPGRTNRTWIRADEPGVYRGQCAEYCGVQHARMGFVVVAMEPDAFKGWYRNELSAAEEPATQALLEGQRLFQARCSACHTVRGTPAGGRAGPDLTHVASRLTLGAGTLPNEPEEMAYWINHNQEAKPGNRMAEFDLSERDLALTTNYLMSLE